MIRSMRPTYRHVFVVLAIVVSVYFAVRTSGAVLVDRSLAAQLQQQQAAVGTLEQQNAALQSRLAYEQTPAYAEQIAREQLGLMKPGDHVVHVQIASLPPGTIASVAPAAPKAGGNGSPATVPNWKRWLRLVTSPSRPSIATPAHAAS